MIWTMYRNIRKNKFSYPVYSWSTPHFEFTSKSWDWSFFSKILSKNFFGGQMSATSFLESSMKVNIEYRFSINSFRMGKMHRGQQTCMILSNIFISHSEHYCLILSKNYQKSDNLQYNMLDCWDEWLIDQVSDVQIIIFFHNFLQNSLQKLLQFILLSFFTNLQK